MCAVLYVQQVRYDHIVTKITPWISRNNIYNLGKYCLIMPRNFSNLTDHFDHFDHFIVNSCSIQNVYNYESGFEQSNVLFAFLVHSMWFNTVLWYASLFPYLVHSQGAFFINNMNGCQQEVQVKTVYK